MERAAWCLPASLCALPWLCHSCSLAVLSSWCLSLRCCFTGERNSGSIPQGPTCSSECQNCSAEPSSLAMEQQDSGKELNLLVLFAGSPCG